MQATQLCRLLPPHAGSIPKPTGESPSQVANSSLAHPQESQFQRCADEIRVNRSRGCKANLPNKRTETSHSTISCWPIDLHRILGHGCRDKQAQIDDKKNQGTHIRLLVFLRPTFFQLDSFEPAIRTARLRGCCASERVETTLRRGEFGRIVRLKRVCVNWILKTLDSQDLFRKWNEPLKAET